MLPNDDFDKWRTVIVESDRFGGTCLNRGCIPSKMYVYAADVALSAQTAGKYGVDAKFSGVDWPAIRDRIFGRIDPIHQSAVDYRRKNGFTVLKGQARFVGPKELRVDDETFTADRIVVAAGSRPRVPDIPGLEDVTFHTSDTVMRLKSLPESMVILGGGFIAAELGHVFGSFGTKITIVARGARMLTVEDNDIGKSFTDAYRQRFDLRLGRVATRVSKHRGGIRVELDNDDTVDAEVVLVALGRVPNTDRLDVAAAGIETDEHGHVVTDSTYETNVPDVFALGDVANHFQLKHMANAETRLIQHNLTNPDDKKTISFDLVPSAVFASPKVSSVGLTERELRASGRQYVTIVHHYSSAAFGWAMEDTTSFVKLIADEPGRHLLGAHILGPQAPTLLQPLLQGMFLGSTVEEMARGVLYVHPAMTEVVEQALLKLLETAGAQ